MNYADGQDVKLGDRVLLWNGCQGFVVCSIDTHEYSADFPQEQWEYLASGVMIRTEKLGLVHYIEPDEDFQLVERK